VRLQIQRLRDLLRKMEGGGHWTKEERKEAMALLQKLIATSVVIEATV
jgi:hypothetical protein